MPGLKGYRAPEAMMARQVPKGYRVLKVQRGLKAFLAQQGLKGRPVFKGILAWTEPQAQQAHQGK